LKELYDRVEAFIADDVEPTDQSELSGWLSRARGGDPAAHAELVDRFSGPLVFGTAGLRGIYGPGETRMNRAVVIRATAGLCDYLLATVPDAAERGLVIGRDGRRGSVEMQRDAALVACAKGLKVHFLEGTTPTPVTAFGVKHHHAAAGVMVTASHNPPAYNGYKVYFGNGAQIIPPQDEGIAQAIARQPGAKAVPRADWERAIVQGNLQIDRQVEAAYLSGLAAMVYDPAAPVGALKIAYSAMHGVGERVLRRAFATRGLTQLVTVAEQAEPDGRFPTVEFPNPEEPGALDLVLALAQKSGSDLVVVNDPDADRLGAAVRRLDGEYQVLNGNEIGVLLADHLLTHDGADGAKRLVMATMVSSQLLRKMAADRGVEYRETLTGFKWIANEALRHHRELGLRFVFGYEEALGYTVGTHVRDKDGISAAMVLCEHAAGLKAHGQTLLDRLDELRRTHGLFVSRQKSLMLPGREGLAKIKEVMAALRSSPPQRFGDLLVQEVRDLSVAPDPRLRGDVLIYELVGGGRVSVRPSGTEPKIKFYLEVVEEVGADPILVAQKRGEARIDQVLAALFSAAHVSA
jgi:phosphomannomutase